MRPDGDPDRDDYGLPRVDVVVPDDARELDRDLIAYRREERQRRRRARLRRITSRFGRFGVATPIVVTALLIAVVSGTLITVFGPRSVPRPTASSPAASPSFGATATAGGPLPDDPITIDGKPASTRDLQNGIIMIAPAGCDCASIVQALAGRARQGNLASYLASYPADAGPTAGTATSPPATVRVSTSARPPASARVSASPAAGAGELARLAGGTDLGVRLVGDDAGALATDFRATGLTVVLVHIDGIVGSVERSVRSADWLTPGLLAGLTVPGAGTTGS